MVTRYADVTTALRDHAHFSSVRPRDPNEPHDEGPFAGARTMLFSIRRCILACGAWSRATSRRGESASGARIREIAKNLIDAAEGKGELEVMHGLPTHCR